MSFGMTDQPLANIKNKILVSLPVYCVCVGVYLCYYFIVASWHTRRVPTYLVHTPVKGLQFLTRAAFTSWFAGLGDYTVVLGRPTFGKMARNRGTSPTLPNSVVQSPEGDTGIACLSSSKFVGWLPAISVKWAGRGPMTCDSSGVRCFENGGLDSSCVELMWHWLGK